MSRSRKKTPIHGIAGGSEKKDKQLWHRAFRRNIKMSVNKGNENMPHLKEYGNPWSMSKDGKTYWDKPNEGDYPKIWFYIGFEPIIKTYEEDMKHWLVYCFRK